MPSNKIAMLLLNPCTNDSRVVKEAEALTNNGYEVTVFCTEKSPAIGSNKHNGVTYIRHKISPILLIQKYKRKKSGPIQQASSEELVKQTLLLAASADKTKTVKKHTPFIKKVINVTIMPLIRLLLVKSMPLIKHFILKPFIEKDVLAFKPDYIHCHDLNTLTAGIKLSKKIPNCKVVYDAHEMEQHRNPPLNSIQRRWVRFLERHYGRQANAVITVSPAISDFLKIELQTQNISLVYNAPSIAPAKLDITLRGHIGVDTKTPIVSYVGGIFINRGVEDLIKSIALLDGYFLALVGPVSEAYKNQLNALAKNLNVLERVAFIPPVPAHHVVDFISSSDVGAFAIKDVCLSYNYCMPNKLFEMSFAGLPIAASKLHSVEHFLGEIGNGETFTPGDIDDIADKIKHIYNNKDKYKADQVKLSNYTWDSQVETLVKLYENL